MNEVWAGFRQGFGGYYSEFDGSGPYCIDENGRIALITDPRLFTGSTNPRLRTDPAQTSFFEKREFKTFREWDTATTGTYLLRVTAPVNFIVQALGIGAEAGSVRMRPYFGGTPSATFNETLPLIPTNTMTESPDEYAHQLVLEGAVGGTLTGGLQLDALRVKAADNSNFANSIGSADFDEQGRAPGVYYVLLNLDSFIGTLRGRIEERP